MRDTRSSKLEERGGEGVGSKIVKVQDLQERILGLANRDAYQNDEGLPSRRW